MRHFRNKKIAIVGLSAEGRDAAKFFHSIGVSFACFDRRNRKELGDVYAELSSYTNTLYLGDDYLTYIPQYDFIVRTPGMLLSDSVFQVLQKQGAVITSLTKLFFELCTVPIIGVTGTKGKGTTSTLIYEMIKKSGMNVHLGGNVGTPLLSAIESVNSSDWVVLELSSFQLEDMALSPHIAVVLRITSDHLLNFDPLASNFHVNRNAYIEAKKPIVRYQHTRDFAIIYKDDETSASFGNETKARIYTFSKNDHTATSYIDNSRVYVTWKHKTVEACHKDAIILRGSHNLENIAAAALASLAAGVTIADIRYVARTFKGLEHRLETVTHKKGVLYVNDSFSTVPDTTIAAINSYDNPIILIVGGSEKGSDFTNLGKEIAKRNIKALIIVGHMSQRILTAVKSARYKGTIVKGCTTMHDIVRKAQKLSQSGDVVLLSPACASFDMFKNYKERGKLFKHEVSIL